MAEASVPSPSRGRSFDPDEYDRDAGRLSTDPEAGAYGWEYQLRWVDPRSDAPRASVIQWPDQVAKKILDLRQRFGEDLAVEIERRRVGAWEHVSGHQLRDAARYRTRRSRAMQARAAARKRADGDA